MSDDVTRAWQDVGERFTDLGRALKSRLGEPGAGEATAELCTVLSQLAEAASAFASRAEDTVRDPEVRDQAKVVGRALTDALSRTFDTAGDEISALFKRTKGDPPED